MASARIDVHTHLLPGFDDGCKTDEQSLRCASLLVSAGYERAFCTPHLWPNFLKNTPAAIAAGVARLQQRLDSASIPLKLSGGGEINLPSMWPSLKTMADDQIPTYSLAGKYLLFDFWDDQIKSCSDLEPAITHLQSRGLKLVLAHPERVERLQRDPSALDRLIDLGVLLQLNSWCLADPPESPRFTTAVRLLEAGRYFLIGTDLHDPDGMAVRLRGIEVAAEIAGEDALDALMIHNPKMLLE
jgi:protein-tyrosine phosphatase